MDELGLFPLPIALLPGERVPLHIFEERYKELIAECLDEGKEFGLILADDDGLRGIGTRALVVTVLERFDDGRLNIVVEGRERFRLVGLGVGRSFDTASVEPVVDDGPAATPADVVAATEALARVAKLAGAEGPRDGADSFELAARVQLEPGVKQELLELRSERERLRLLARLLDAAARRLAATEERAAIASQNGHPHRAG
jgi:Lon protease-like protein